MRNWLYLVLITVITVSLSACDTGGASPGGELRYFEFTHTTHEETFVVATSDSSVISKVEAQLAKPRSERNLHINGKITRGERTYNPRYSWHFVEGEWDLAEVSTEVCDGRPSLISEDLDYWVDEVGRFCPFSSQVEREVDAPQ
jgi:hypothetical protein